MTELSTLENHDRFVVTVAWNSVSTCSVLLGAYMNLTTSFSDTTADLLRSLGWDRSLLLQAVGISRDKYVLPNGCGSSSNGKPADSRILRELCVCVVIPFVLGVRLVDVPAGVTPEEGHTEFLQLPSAVLALIFIARRIQPSLSLVDREVEFCVPTNSSFSTC